MHMHINYMNLQYYNESQKNGKCFFPLTVQMYNEIFQKHTIVIT